MTHEIARDLDDEPDVEDRKDEVSPTVLPDVPVGGAAMPDANGSQSAYDPDMFREA